MMVKYIQANIARPYDDINTSKNTRPRTASKQF